MGLSALVACGILSASEDSSIGERAGLLAQSSYSAFACSAWAFSLEDEKESERLKDYAVRAGRKAIEAFFRADLEGDVNFFDGFYKNTSIELSAVDLGRVSVDFSLGLLAASAEEYARERSYMGMDKLSAQSLSGELLENYVRTSQQNGSRKWYRSSNCRLIGTE